MAHYTLPDMLWVFPCPNLQLMCATRIICCPWLSSNSISWQRKKHFTNHYIIPPGPLPQIFVLVYSLSRNFPFLRV